MDEIHIQILLDWTEHFPTIKLLETKLKLTLRGGKAENSH